MSRRRSLVTTRVLLNPYRRSILVPSAILLENKKGAARSSFRELMQRRRGGQGERHKSTKQQLCTNITHFCSFLCRCCTTTTWNHLVSRFREDVYTRRKFFFSYSELRYSPLELLLNWNAPTFDKLNEMLGGWKSVNSLLKWRLRCRCRRGCLSSYNLGARLLRALYREVLRFFFDQKAIQIT